MAGGGSDDDGSGLAVTLKNVDLSLDSTYVNMKSDDSSPSVASIALRALADLVGGQNVNAAGGYSMLPEGLDVTRMIQDGQLLDINVKIAAVSEADNERLIELSNRCAIGNPELSIIRVEKLEEYGKMNMVLAHYPAKIQENCDVDYEKGLFIFVENGDAFKMDDDALLFARITPANEGIRNGSDIPLITRYQTDKFEAIIYDKDANTLTFEDLTPSTLTMVREHSYSFDGEYLHARTDQGPDLQFKRGTEGFKELPADSSLNGMFFNTEGEFMTSLFVNDGQVVSEWSGYSTFDPVSMTTAPYHTKPGSNFGSFDVNIVKHHKNKYVNSGLKVWDVDTNQVECMFPDDSPSDNSGCSLYGHVVIEYIGDHVVAYSSYENRFFTYNLETGRLEGSVNLAGTGYVIESDKVTLYKKVAYVEAVNPDNANKEYLEIDLLTGAVTNLGVIQDGSRKAETFLRF